MKRFVPILVLFVFALSSIASATEYWPPDDPRWELQVPRDDVVLPQFDSQRDLLDYLLWKGMIDSSPDGEAVFTGESFLENMFEAASFIATLQVADPETITFGGMREGEHLPLVIQSDNTQESIWVWSRYHSLTGDSTFDANVGNAWQYIMNFPGYSEEGGTGPIGYYRVYNCAWGLWAVMGYEEAYGDLSFRSYGDSCAAYIMANPLDVFSGIFPYGILNGMVQSWALGSLSRYGEYLDDIGIQLTAAEMAVEVKAYVEDSPNKLGWENWAMSGGATMWGILNSYFKRRPDLLANWLADYAVYLRPFDDSGSWNTAHNLWYALGHQAVWEATGSANRKVNHRLLVEAMMGLDTDNDGGIPAQTEDPDTTDQSWVTNYLSFMGFHVLIPEGDVSVSADLYLVQAGGTLSTNLSVANNTDSTITYSGRIEVETPYGPFPGNPLLGPIDFSVGPRGVLSLPLYHPVPIAAPSGLYWYRAYLDVGGEEVDVGEIPFLVVVGP